jgi:hypothetical protein
VSGPFSPAKNARAEQLAYGRRWNAGALFLLMHGDIMFAPWFSLALDAARLGAEAQKVIELRLARLAAGGPDAPFEAHRMVAEKQLALIEAALVAGASLASGNAGHIAARKVVKGYRKHVRVNSRRLSRAA